VRDLIREQIDTLLDEAGELVDAQSARLKDLGERLEQQNLRGPAGLAGTVAAEAEELADRLAEIDGDRVLDAARVLAQRRGPWVFAAGGAAAGLLLWTGLRRALSDDARQRVPAAELEAPHAQARDAERGAGAS
jgi:hypothetical protein